ncbi:hypothetical protein CTAYLR_007342 [Chrysophaeum taylorii]|uniref:Uncharacterized protein n=1 Tax=Chrysophaeum taylorii TaxID=2483200 RepID=A0AAD7XRH2_9STRA|nr:hypothetical protein CTAYLR_007342 [Chrysophaeum taylorii]
MSASTLEKSGTCNRLLRDAVDDESPSRLRPIANVVCHALTSALRLELGKEADEALTMNEMAALREALARENPAVLGLLRGMLVAERVSDDAFSSEEGGRHLAGLLARDRLSSVHPEQQPTTWATSVKKPPDPLVPRQPHMFPLMADSSERAKYQQVDVAHLLRNIIRSLGVSCHHIAQYDVNNDGLVQFDEIAAFFTHTMGIQLLDSETEALHDLLDNSMDTIRVTDLATFLEKNDRKSEISPSRLEIERKNTVTTVAISPDAKRVGFGGMDCAVSIYDLGTHDLLFQKKCPKQVGALSLGRAGLAVGCFGGHLEFRASLSVVVDDPAAVSSSEHDVSGVTTWQMGKDVHTVALNEDDREVAVAAGTDVCVYCLRTHALVYKFAAKGTVWGVSLARVVAYQVALDDGRGSKVELTSGVLEVETPGTHPSKWPHFESRSFIPQLSRRVTSPEIRGAAPDDERGDDPSSSGRRRGRRRRLQDHVFTKSASFTAPSNNAKVAAPAPSAAAAVVVVVNDDNEAREQQQQQHQKGGEDGKPPPSKNSACVGVPRLASNLGGIGSLRHRNQWRSVQHAAAAAAEGSRRKTTIIAEGVLRISTINRASVGKVMLDALDSLPWLCIVILLATATFTLAVLRATRVNAARATLLVDLWVTAIFVLEVVLRMVYMLQTHHTLQSFFANAYCVLDLVVIGIDFALMVAGTRDKFGGIPKVLRLAHLSKVKKRWMQQRAKNKKRKQPGTEKQQQQLQPRHASEVVKYDVELPTGLVVRDVPREDIVSTSEREYIEFRHRVETTRGPNSSSAPHSSCCCEPGSRASFRLRFTRRLSLSTEEMAAKRRSIDPHLKSSLGERDRMAVMVRLHARSSDCEVRKYIAFGGESQQACVWSYDLTEAQLETKPHQATTENYISRMSGWCTGDGEVESSGRRTPPPPLHEKWTTANSTPIARQEWSMKFEHAVSSVSLSGDARRVAGCARNLTFVYDFGQRCLIFQHASTDLVYGVALSYYGDDVLFGGASKKVQLHDVATGAGLYATALADRVRCVALSFTGKFVAFGGFDAKMHVHHVEYGATGAAVESSDVVRSVSLDRGGTILAVGGDDCCCRCYSLRETPVELWTAVHDSKVWVVAVEPSARYVAAGDYSNAVVVYDAETGEHAWQKTTWVGEGAPFTWSVAWSADGRYLAIGKWDCRAYLVRVDAGWTEVAVVRRSDRVYSVALSRDASLLCVGGRDKRGVVYQVDHRRGACRVDFETEPQGGFVYCVAISHDATWFAMGGVDGVVGIYALKYRCRVHTIAQEGLIQNLAFSPVSLDLAIASEQNYVEIWQLSGGAEYERPPITKLVLRRHTSTHDVALSATGFAYCSGSLFSTFGGGRKEPKWDDRMNFEMLQASLNHRKSLETILREHPTVVNAQSPLSGESLLQYAVRKKTSATVDALLGADCRVGFPSDVNGNNALTVALEHERKNVLSKLLDATMNMLRHSPLVSSSFMDIQAAIADKYPDLYLSFLERVTLMRDTKLVPLNRNFALMPQRATFITAGSDEHSPSGFWDPYLLTISSLAGGGGGGGGGTPSSPSSGAASCSPPNFGIFGCSAGTPSQQPQLLRSSGVGADERASASQDQRESISIFSSRRTASSIFELFGHSGPLAPHYSSSSSLGTLSSLSSIYSNDEYRKNHRATELHRLFLRHHARNLTQGKKTEVVALRVPFEFVLGKWDVDGPAKDSVLSLVAKSSADLESYTAYGSVLVQCIIQFKWDHYGRWIFLTEFALCVLHLVVVCVLYFSMLDNLGLSWSARATKAGVKGVVTIAAFGPAVFISSVFISIEVRQLLIQGRGAYFSSHKHWKILDLACFGLQIFVDALLLSKVKAGIAFFAALNLLCFTCRIISFARGFKKWGPLVRMIVKIVYEVRFFVGIVLVLITGFCASFAVLLRRPPSVWLVVYLVQSGLYAHVAEEKHLVPTEWPDRQGTVVFMFQVFMLIVALLVLNLLIAIMNSAYEDVKASAVQEMLHEKSQIILAIERLWLPMLVSHYRIPPSYFFPKWLLILAPAHHFDSRTTDAA